MRAGTGLELRAGFLVRGWRQEGLRKVLPKFCLTSGIAGLHHRIADLHRGVVSLQYGFVRLHRDIAGLH